MKPGPRPVRALIVRRELQRLSRRWQLVLARLLPVALLTGLFVIVLATFGSRIEADQIPQIGRAMYATSAVALFVMVGFIVPTTLARAVQLERDEGTLDLLALTGVSPTQGLWGTVGTRLISTVLVVLGTLPLIALVPTLGGVAPGEVASLLMVLPAMALVLGAVAGLTGLVSQSVAMPVVVTALFALTFGLLLPLRLAWSLYRTTGGQSGFEIFVLAPASTAFDPDVWVPLGIVPWLAVAAIAAFVATWRFRRAVATGWDSHAKAWPGPRRGWVVHVPIVAGGMLLFEVLGWLELPGAGPMAMFGAHPIVARNGLLGLAVVTWFSAAMLYLRASVWLIPRLSMPRRRRWVPVFGNPVLWRELFTTAHGGLGRAMWILTGAWLLIAVLIVAGGEEELLVGWGLMGAFLTLALTVVLLATSIVDERRRRTLPLLCTATIQPVWIVLGKVTAVGVRVLPLAVLGFLAVAVNLHEEILDLQQPSAGYDFGYGHRSAWGDPLLVGVPLARLPLILAWIGAVWTLAATGTVAIAVRARSLALAWTAPIIVAACSPIVVFLAIAATEQLRRYFVWAELLSTAVFPFQRAFLSVGRSGIPPELVVSTSLWTALALLTVALATGWLAKWGPRTR